MQNCYLEDTFNFLFKFINLVIFKTTENSVVKVISTVYETPFKYVSFMGSAC